MILYRPIAWKESEEQDVGYGTSYQDAKEYGCQIYPSGFDIEEVDTDEWEEEE